MTTDSMPTGFDSGPKGSSTVLYLVRHGETEYNRKGIVQGAGIDSELNDTGVAQAEALSERLAEVPIDGIYASTLRRARQTADVLASPHEPVPKTYLPDLEEIDWGVFEGDPPSEERNRAMDRVKERWREGQYGYRIAEGESIRNVEARVHRAIEQVVAQESETTVLVVTHGRYLRVLLASLLNDYGLEDMHRLGHANTCVNRVRYDNGRFEADLLNCTAHLDTQECAS